MVLQHAHVVSILICVITVGEGSSRLCILLGGFPFSLFDIFSRQEGVQELDVLFVVHLLRWFFYLLGPGSIHFVPCISPFFGALFFYD
jgi:hypothetical protein